MAYELKVAVSCIAIALGERHNGKCILIEAGEGSFFIHGEPDDMDKLADIIKTKAEMMRHPMKEVD